MEGGIPLTFKIEKSGIILTRADQPACRSDRDEDIFMCFAYESISEKDKTKEVLQEMEDYMDQKYGKHGAKRKG